MSELRTGSARPTEEPTLRRAAKRDVEAGAELGSITRTSEPGIVDAAMVVRTGSAETGERNGRDGELGVELAADDDCPRGDAVFCPLKACSERVAENSVTLGDSRERVEALASRTDDVGAKEDEILGPRPRRAVCSGDAGPAVEETSILSSAEDACRGTDNDLTETPRNGRLEADPRAMSTLVETGGGMALLRARVVCATASVDGDACGAIVAASTELLEVLWALQSSCWRIVRFATIGKSSCRLPEARSPSIALRRICASAHDRSGITTVKITCG